VPARCRALWALRPQNTWIAAIQGPGPPREEKGSRDARQNQDVPLLDQVLARHPRMKEFLAHPEVEIISVRVNSFLFLDWITEAHYVTR
jgi:hypothetical protein